MTTPARSQTDVDVILQIAENKLKSKWPKFNITVLRNLYNQADKDPSGFAIDQETGVFIRFVGTSRRVSIGCTIVSELDTKHLETQTSTQVYPVTLV